MTVPSVSMKSALGMAHPAPVNGGDLALGPDHVAHRHLRSSSLLWLRRRTSCSASVPVTGGSVSAELLHQQLDLVTGIAALLAVDMRACTVRPCPWTRCRTSTRSGIPRGGHCPEASGTCHTSRHLGRTASRGVLSPRHVPPSRSRRTASRRGRSPAPLGQRAGGLRCSRLHSGVCSHTPHLLTVRSLLPYK